MAQNSASSGYFRSGLPYNEKMGHPAVGKQFEREVLTFLREA